MTDTDRLRQYVLGALSEADREELETRLLEDHVLHEQLELAEDALVEGYLRGMLPASERAAFEARLASNLVLAEEVRCAGILRDGLAGRTAPGEGAGATRSRPAVYGMAVAALLLLALGLWLWPGRPAPSPLTAGGGASPRPSPLATASPGPESGPPGSEPPAAVAALTLSAGQAMAGGAIASVAVDPGIGRLRLTLVLEEPIATTYAAEVWNDANQRLWRKDGLRPDRRQASLSVMVPAARLPAGRYRLELAPEGSADPIDRIPYHFTVRRAGG